MVSCDVYKSDRRELMYLYVLEGEGLERVPAALMKTFGSPTFVLNVELTPDKALAKEDPRWLSSTLKRRAIIYKCHPSRRYDVLEDKDAGRDERRGMGIAMRPMRPLLSRQIGR